MRDRGNARLHRLTWERWRGGVVLGEAGNAPCLFWTRAGQKNVHMAVYPGSGAGKGVLMRAYHSRKLFRHDVILWAIDSDEQHE